MKPTSKVGCKLWSCIIAILTMLAILVATLAIDVGISQAQGNMQYANSVRWCNHPHASDPYCQNVLGEQDHQFTILFADWNSGVSVGFPYPSGGPVLIYYAADENIELRLHFYKPDGSYICSRQTQLLPSPPNGSALHIAYPCTYQFYQIVLTEVLAGTVNIDAFGAEVPTGIMHLPMIIR